MLMFKKSQSIFFSEFGLGYACYGNQQPVNLSYLKQQGRIHPCCMCARCILPPRLSSMSPPSGIQANREASTWRFQVSVVGGEKRERERDLQITHWLLKFQPFH